MFDLYLITVQSLLTIHCTFLPSMPHTSIRFAHCINMQTCFAHVSKPHHLAVDATLPHSSHLSSLLFHTTEAVRDLCDIKQSHFPCRLYMAVWDSPVSCLMIILLENNYGYKTFCAWYNVRFGEHEGVREQI